MPYSDAQRRMAKAYGVNVERLDKAIRQSEERSAARERELVRIRQERAESIAGLREAADKRKKR